MRINTDKNCNIVIHDDTEYPINGIAYKNSVSLYIAQLNESSKSTIIYQKFDKHDGSGDDPIILSPQKGGFITFCHIILPKTPAVSGDYLQIKKLITKNQINDILGILDSIDTIIPDTEDFVQSETYITLNQINDILGLSHIQEEPRTFLDTYVETDNYITFDQIDSIWNGSAILRSVSSRVIQTPNLQANGTGYFSDGDKIYYSNGSTVREVSIQEIIDVNPAAYNFVKTIDNFFSVCYLRKCYISLCQKIFKGRGFNRCFTEKVDSQLIHKRDLVWSALNVIQYMIDSNQLAEAQRLLERINGCNGLCSKEETGDQGCGCES